MILLVLQLVYWQYHHNLMVLLWNSPCQQVLKVTSYTDLQVSLVSYRHHIPYCEECFLCISRWACFVCISRWAWTVWHLPPCVIVKWPIFSANNSSQTPYMSANENVVWIRSMDPDYFQNLTGTSLSKDASVTKFSPKSDHSVWRYEPNSVKMPYLTMLKNPSKNSWIRIRMTSKI